MNRSKKSQDPRTRARDTQTKFIKDTVNKVEKSFATICGQFGAVNRRNSRLRDKFDEMAKFMVSHANTEPGPLKVTLTHFAEHISAIQDYRQAMIDRMDGKVIQPLSSYKTSCKHTQTDLNVTMKSRGRELKKHQQLDTVRNKAPSDTRQITRAETDLKRATLDVERSTKSLEETIDSFESKRVADIKKILSEFVQIEMLFHAKALERLTSCYQNLQNLNVDDHLVLFRNSLRPSPVQERLDMVAQQAGINLQQQQQQGPVVTPQGHDSSYLQSNGENEQDEQGTYDEDYDDQEEEDYSEEGESEYETDEDEGMEGSPENPQQRRQQARPW